MIISASRRTDIPALFSAWFMNRIEAGFCRVPNPYSGRLGRVSLLPKDVDAIVFWTKNPRPLLPRLEELTARGFAYYFLYTLNDYSRTIEPSMPPVRERLETFRRLSEFIGPQRVIWRYDPIVLSNLTDEIYHRETFARLCEALRGSTSRSIISVLDVYKKVRLRLAAAAGAGLRVREPEIGDARLAELVRAMGASACAAGIELTTCAEDLLGSSPEAHAGSCIDAGLLASLGVQILGKKDRGQRASCRCVESRDIGVNNTCTHGCIYCYATDSLEAACSRYATHDPNAPSIAGAAFERPAAECGKR